jgi:hypothetical protein
MCRLRADRTHLHQTHCAVLEYVGLIWVGAVVVKA